MPTVNRRAALQAWAALAIPSGFVMLITACDRPQGETSLPTAAPDKVNRIPQNPNWLPTGELMKIRYLEIVTPEVDAMCRQYSSIYGMSFSAPDNNLGGARTAKLDEGGLMGIRAPMRETESPVVRPYVGVDDIHLAVDSAADAGAEIAMPPTVIPGHGTFAIVILGGIESGLWQD